LGAVCQIDKTSILLSSRRFWLVFAHVSTFTTPMVSDVLLSS
jgi:hypothetical protein